MAIKIKTKPKPKRIGKSAANLFDLKHWGDEPIVTGQVDESKLIGIFNYYNYMHDISQAKKWILEYLKKNKSSSELISNLRSAPDHMTTTTSGWMARMMMNGSIFSDTYMERFNQRIEHNAKAGIKIETDVVKDKTTVSIQDRVKKSNERMLSDAESEVIDDRKSMYDFLQGRQASPAAAKRMLDYYQPIYDELHSDDEDVKDAFGKKLKAECEFMDSVITDLNRYIGNKKVIKIRKPREKKTKSAVELVKNVKFQKEFAPLKIVSVNPSDIIGSKQLWVYNTKYKKLTRYDAVGPNGIQVKGTTLIGIDVETSITKSLRKPELTIQQLLTAGKIALRSILTDLKTNETKPNGRLGTESILLRVIK